MSIFNPFTWFNRKPQMKAPDFRDFCVRTSPPDPRLDIGFRTKDSTLIITWGEYTFDAAAVPLCQAFREGRGYERVDRLVDMLYTSGGVARDDLKQFRDFLRAWGHVNETRF